MTLTAPAHPRSRPGATSRRFGYLVAVELSTLFLYLINVRPGWEAVPFLTPDTPQVLGLLNFSIVTGIVVNAAHLVYDARWFRALGELATAAIGLAVLVRIWQVFPFDFGGYERGWPVPLVRTVLVGTAIGLLVNLGLLLRHTLGKREGE